MERCWNQTVLFVKIYLFHYRDYVIGILGIISKIYHPYSPGFGGAPSLDGHNFYDISVTTVQNNASGFKQRALIIDYYCFFTKMPYYLIPQLLYACYDNRAAIPCHDNQLFMAHVNGF